MRLKELRFIKKGGDLFCEAVLWERLSSRRNLAIIGVASLAITKPDDNGFVVTIIKGKKERKEVSISIDSTVTVPLDIYVEKPRREKDEQIPQGSSQYKERNRAQGTKTEKESARRRPAGKRASAAKRKKE